MQNNIKTAATVALAAAALASAGPAMAQSAMDNSRLPKLADIRPLPAQAEPGLFHDIEISIEQGYGNAVNKAGEPTKLDQKSYQTSLRIKADIGDMLFAGISGTYSREDIASTNLAFSMNVAGAANVLGADAVIGIKPVPYLSMGLMGGVGSAGASYTFTDFPAAPATPGDSRTRRIGAFLDAFYGIDRLLLSASASVLDIQTNVDYGPGNTPQTDSFGTTLLLGKLGASYQLTDQLTIGTSVTFNHVMSQVVAAAQTGIDPDWLTVEAGLKYQLTPQISVHAKAATWLMNDRMNFTRVAVGATYSF